MSAGVLEPLFVAGLVATAAGAGRAARRADRRLEVASRLSPPPGRAARGRPFAGGRQRRAAEERVLPAFLEEAARALRSGAALRGAVVAAVEAQPPAGRGSLEGLAAAARAGQALPAAVDDWAAGCATPGSRLAAAALALAAASGGSAARSLDAVATTLRDRAAAAADARAMASQARLSALVIGLAPLAFSAVAAGVDAHAASFLLGSPVGWACLVAGLALDAAGLWWMSRIVAGAMP